MRTTKRLRFVCFGLLLCSTTLTAIWFGFVYKYWSLKESRAFPCLSDVCLHVSSQIIRRLNQSTEPCSNFYNFACGGYARNAVPWNSPNGVDAYTDMVENVQSDLYSLLTFPSSDKKSNEVALATNSLSSFMRSCETFMSNATVSQSITNIIEVVIKTDVKQFFSEKSSFDSATILQRLTDIGQPLLLNFAVRSSYRGIPCVGHEERNSSSSRSLCIDIVPPVLHLLKDDTKMKDFKASLAKFVTDGLVDTRVENPSFYRDSVDDLSSLHGTISRIYRRSATQMQSTARNEISYTQINLSGNDTSFSPLYTQLIRRMNVLTNTPSRRVFVRNRKTLIELGSILSKTNDKTLILYAIIETYARLKLLFGDYSGLKSGKLHVLDPQLLAILKLVSNTGKTDQLRIPQNCFQLTYSLHRPHFKAIYELLHTSGGKGEAHDDIIDQVKKTFIYRLNQSLWMTDDVRNALISVIETMPLNSGTIQNVDFSSITSANTSSYGNFFIHNFQLALKNSVVINGNAWTALGNIAEHLHTFARFRQYFRDGIMWRHLSADFFPNYIRYARIGYLVAYELADILETHPLSIYSALDRMFTLSKYHELDYIFRRKRLMKLYETLAPTCLPYANSLNDDKDREMSIYRPQMFIQDIVANSLAISVAHEAFLNSFELLKHHRYGKRSRGNMSFADDEHSLRLVLNFDTFSDEKKFFVVMTQMWCSRTTSEQFRRTYLEETSIVAANEAAAGLGGSSATGLSQTQPGPLTTSVMTFASNIFQNAFSCNNLEQEDIGIFSHT